ncbi:MAG TPA: AAA family ATPase [Actinocrinis sp.]|nr:AAA family ATPase [Actinocrinis sp.]
MITRIEIDGFKSFVDFELDVPPLLVLVGANNGGKSNLLQALDLYRDLQQGGPGFAFNRRGRGSAMFHRDVHGRERDEFTVAVATVGEAMPVRTVRDSRGSLASLFPMKSATETSTGGCWSNWTHS